MAQQHRVAHCTKKCRANEHTKQRHTHASKIGVFYGSNTRHHDAGDANQGGNQVELGPLVPNESERRNSHGDARCFPRRNHAVTKPKHHCNRRKNTESAS